MSEQDREQAKILLAHHLQYDHGCPNPPKDLDGMRVLHREHHPEMVD